MIKNLFNAQLLQHESAEKDVIIPVKINMLGVTVIKNWF